MNRFSNMFDLDSFFWWSSNKICHKCFVLNYWICNLYLDLIPTYHLIKRIKKIFIKRIRTYICSNEIESSLLILDLTIKSQSLCLFRLRVWGWPLIMWLAGKKYEITLGFLMDWWSVIWSNVRSLSCRSNQTWN